MSNVVRWEPRKDIMSLREAMDRLFEDSFVGPRFSPFRPTAEEGVLPIDFYQTEDEFVVKASVPGIEPEDIDVSITGSTLVIQGEAKSEEKVEKQDYIFQERRYGKFQRTLTLPTEVQADSAEAIFENGVLVLTLPKAEEVKPQPVKVTVK